MNDCRLLPRVRASAFGQYCRAAIYDALSKDKAEETAEPPKPHFDIESLIALRKQTFGDRVLPTDSAEMIREAREERTRHLESLVDGWLRWRVDASLAVKWLSKPWECRAMEEEERVGWC